MVCFFNSSPDPIRNQNRWLNHFTSPANRHVLPLLTSLINVVCTYDPVGYGVPYVSAHLLASLSHTHILLFFFFFHHPSLSFLSPFSLLSLSSLSSPLLSCLYRYYYAMVTDLREQLVETCSHVLAVLLDYSPAIPSGHAHSLLPPEEGKSPAVQVQEETGLNNLFVAYMSRLHQADVSEMGVVCTLRYNL